MYNVVIKSTSMFTGIQKTVYHFRGVKIPHNWKPFCCQTLKHFDNFIVSKTLSKCLRVWQQVFERWTCHCLADYHI